MLSSNIQTQRWYWLLQISRQLEHVFLGIEIGRQLLYLPEHLTQRLRQKLMPFWSLQLRIYFLEWTNCILIKILLEFVPNGPSIGSDNGLALIRQQAIIWINGGIAYWCMYVSLSQFLSDGVTLKPNFHWITMAKSFVKLSPDCDLFRLLWISQG